MQMVNAEQKEEEILSAFPLTDVKITIAAIRKSFLN